MLGISLESWGRIRYGDDVDFVHPLSTVTPTLDADVLAVLARADQALTGREIYKIASRGSESGIRRVAERLVGEGVVLRESVGRAHHYRLNREHLAAPWIEGLAFLLDELLHRLRSAVERWDEPPLVAVVFGSVARGEATASSDLDILVIRRGGGEPESAGWEDQLFALQKQATLWTGNDTRVLEFTEDELRSAPPEPALKEAAGSGIELYGPPAALRRLALGATG